MTLSDRLTRFTVVSAGGFVVQLVTVALLTGFLGVGSVAATGLGVGGAIGHNFFWHRRWTWNDRIGEPRTASYGAASLSTFLRFVAGNGAVSLVANLVIVGVLADTIGLQVVLANVVAVAVCGLLNFQIGDRLVFRAPGRAS